MSIKLKKLTLALGLATMMAGTVPTAAMAHYTGKPHNAGPRHRAAGDYHTNRDWRGYRDDRRYYRDDRVRYERRNCKTSGTTGLLLGAVAGGLLGRTIDTHGDRTAGTLLGGGAGALLGKQIDSKRRC